MGNPNSKSNSPEKKKEIPTKQDINETNNTNLDISMRSIDNSIESQSNYKGISYDKRKNKNNLNIPQSDNYISDQITQEKTHSENNSGLYYNIIWNGEGNDVSISGSFDNWKVGHKMKKNGNNTFEYEIPISNIHGKKTVEFKFIIVKNWICSNNYPKNKDNDGNLNNYIDEKYINEHPENIRNANNETLTSTNNNTKINLDKSKDNSKDISSRSIYGNIYPNEDQMNQEAPNMPDVLDVSLGLNEFSPQQIIGNKNYLKYIPINLCSSYKNIFLPGHSYMDHIFSNRKQHNKYFEINCSIKTKGKCLSIIYLSPVEKKFI